MRPIHATTLIALLAFAPACVSKAKYSELESTYQTVVTQNNTLRGKNAALQKQIDARDAAAKARLESYRELVKELKPLVDKGLLEVTVDEGRVVVGMSANVLFASGSAELSEQGRATVVKVGKVLVARTDRDLQIQGHTDSDAISGDSFSDNWDLGSARAMAVVAAMTNAGVSKDRLSAATFADTRPVAKNDSDANKARNRRIEVVIEPDFSDLPGFDQLMEEVPEKTRRPRRGGKGGKDGKGGGRPMGR